MIRTREAGAVRAPAAGTRVALAGWVARRRDHGGVVFIDLRDASGVTQVVLREEDLAHDLRSEYCVRVTGEVRRRPAGNENPELPTGDIEVAGAAIEGRARSDPPPVPGEGGGALSGGIPRRSRYLDLPPGARCAPRRGH